MDKEQHGKELNAHVAKHGEASREADKRSGTTPKAPPQGKSK